MTSIEESGCTQHQLIPLDQVLAAAQLQMQWSLALQLLQQMVLHGLSPDAISFAAGIDSCVLGGPIISVMSPGEVIKLRQLRSKIG